MHKYVIPLYLSLQLGCAAIAAQQPAAAEPDDPTIPPAWLDHDIFAQRHGEVLHLYATVEYHGRCYPPSMHERLAQNHARARILELLGQGETSLVQSMSEHSSGMQSTYTASAKFFSGSLGGVKTVSAWFDPQDKSLRVLVRAIAPRSDLPIPTQPDIDIAAEQVPRHWFADYHLAHGCKEFKKVKRTSRAIAGHNDGTILPPSAAAPSPSSSQGLRPPPDPRNTGNVLDLAGITRQSEE